MPLSAPALAHAGGCAGAVPRVRGCRQRHPARGASPRHQRPAPGAGALPSDQQQQQGGLDPTLEMAVPPEQRPVNELAALKQSMLYSWATLPWEEYVGKLVGVFGGFMLLAAPIAAESFPPLSKPLEFGLSSCTGSLLVVSAAVVRIYLGWTYVGDRLLSAAISYEETGWYDGQTFVKPREVLMRDRLLGTYDVKPTLAKLRRTLIGSGALVLVCSLALAGLLHSQAPEARYGRAMRAPRQVTADGVLYGARARRLTDLINDDTLAQEEAAAQNGVPGYCGDRFFRAFAGGQYCAKFDR